MPPVYQVRQFIPLDETSQARLEEMRAEGPPDVIFDTRCHWAQTEEDEAYFRVS
jgi:hypothetical protein